MLSKLFNACKPMRCYSYGSMSKNLTQYHPCNLGLGKGFTTVAQFSSPGGVGNGEGGSVPTVGVTTAGNRELLSECSDGTCTLGVWTMTSAAEEELAANV